MGKVPTLDRTYPGRKGKYGHRKCPYSTEDVTERVPLAERTDHLDTGGRMDPSPSLGAGIVYQCNSNYCSFYQGTAVTELSQGILELNVVEGEYIYTERLVPIVICPGTRFREY